MKSSRPRGRRSDGEGVGAVLPHEPVDRAAQRVAGVARAGVALELPLPAAREDLAQHVVLAVEVAVDRGVRQTRLGGDVADADVEPGRAAKSRSAASRMRGTISSSRRGRPRLPWCLPGPSAPVKRVSSLVAVIYTTAWSGNSSPQPRSRCDSSFAARSGSASTPFSSYYRSSSAPCSSTRPTSPSSSSTCRRPRLRRPCADGHRTGARDALGGRGRGLRRRRPAAVPPPDRHRGAASGTGAPVAARGLARLPGRRPLAVGRRAVAGVDGLAAPRRRAPRRRPLGAAQAAAYPYELWQGTHGVLAMVLVVAAVAHILAVGRFSALPAMRVLWGVYLVGVHRPVREVPARRGRCGCWRRPWEVVENRAERGARATVDAAAGRPSRVHVRARAVRVGRVRTHALRDVAAPDLAVVQR